MVPMLMRVERRLPDETLCFQRRQPHHGTRRPLPRRPARFAEGSCDPCAQGRRVSDHRHQGQDHPPPARRPAPREGARSEEHTSELQSLMRISYAVFCLKKKNHDKHAHKATQFTNTPDTKQQSIYTAETVQIRIAHHVTLVTQLL